MRTDLVLDALEQALYARHGIEASIGSVCRLLRQRLGRDHQRSGQD